MWNLGLLGAAAAGEPVGFDLLEQANVSSPTSTITFNNLLSYSSDYSLLTLRISTRSTRNAVNDTLYMKINNDNSAKYNFHFVYGDGSQTGSGASNNTSDGMRLGIIAGATNGYSQLRSAIVTDFMWPFETDRNLTISSQNTGKGSSWDFFEYASGMWENLSAVDEIDLFCTQGGQFESNSVFRLYGKGKK
jgi:hypothetical protein